MHDGGANTTLYVQRKHTDRIETACASIMGYNTRPGYGEVANASTGPPAVEGHSHGGQDMHISDPGVCFNFGHVSQGDSVWIEAMYDTGRYPLQSHNEKLENLMGIMRLYIGPDGK
jgi:hypothetical protein